MRLLTPTYSYERGTPMTRRLRAFRHGLAGALVLFPTGRDLPKLPRSAREALVGDMGQIGGDFRRAIGQVVPPEGTKQVRRAP